MAGTEQLGLIFQAPPRKIYAVRELVAELRTQVERAFTDVYLEGEISNYRPADSGHLYFTLKDASAQLRAVMWRTQARLLRFRPENGLQVIARGRVTIYDERGDLQFQAEYLEPKGAGALQVAFEQLKAKLAAEGLFDAARKKPIPVLPARIGLVTSPQGAAVQDILNVLQRRHESMHVLIYPAQVQGEAAAAEVSAGVRYFNRRAQVDVIIVTRGGGSFEDLFAFNDEGLARVIAGSAIPVISAVGHETDFTICDFVSDLRAPTPSAAAELVVRSKRELSDKLLGFHKRMTQSMNYKLLRAHNELSRLAQHAVFARMRDTIARRQQRIDDLVFRLAQAKSRMLKAQGRRLELLEAKLRHHDLRVRTGADAQPTGRAHDATAYDDVADDRRRGATNSIAYRRQCSMPGRRCYHAGVRAGSGCTARCRRSRPKPSLPAAMRSFSPPMAASSEMLRNWRQAIRCALKWPTASSRLEWRRR